MPTQRNKQSKQNSGINKTKNKAQENSSSTKTKKTTTKSSANTKSQMAVNETKKTRTKKPNANTKNVSVDTKREVKAKKQKEEKAKKVTINEEAKVHLFVKGKKIDFGLFAIVLVLVTVGLVMLLSASAPYSLRTEGDSYYYFMKQLKFAGLGLVLMLIISKFDYRILNSRLSYLAYLAGLRSNVTCTSTWNWCKKK